MSFTALTSAMCDANSPLDETLMQRIRTNFDDHESRLLAAFAFGTNFIGDDFLAVNSAAGIVASTWLAGSLGAGNAPVVAAEHQLQCPTATAGAGNYSAVTAAAGKINIVKTEEYTAVLQFRAKRAGSNNDSYFMGWQDAALTAAAATCVTDTTDMAGFYRDVGTGNWTFQTANGGAATTSTGIGTGASWGVFRISITCSATAGNRQIVVEHGATEAALAAISGSPFTTNLTTQRLTPCFGQAYVAVGGDLRVDYVLAYTTGRPLAA